jgi:hypothetical protein
MVNALFRLARRSGYRYKMPSTMSETLDGLREEVWDSMLTADYNSRYWEYLFKRYYRRQKVAEIFLAVTSSSSVAAWSIWRDINLLWQCLAGSSTLVAVILPILNYKKQIADLSEILSQWVQIRAEYELLWFDIEHGTPTRDHVIDQYKKLKRREIEVDKITSSIPDDERLLDLCRQQVINARTETAE